MVQNIDGSSRPRPNTKQNNESLRANFRSLTSAKAEGRSSERAADSGGRDVVGLNKIIDGLNDAVSFSAKALDSIERITGGGRSGGAAGEPFVGDLDRLRKDLGQTIESLQSGIETAEVIRENVAAAGTRLEDIDVAQERVAQVVEDMDGRRGEAVAAHKDLQPQRVADLLSE